MIMLPSQRSSLLGLGSFSNCNRLRRAVINIHMHLASVPVRTGIWMHVKMGHNDPSPVPAVLLPVILLNLGAGVGGPCPFVFSDFRIYELGVRFEKVWEFIISMSAMGLSPVILGITWINVCIVSEKNLDKRWIVLFALSSVTFWAKALKTELFWRAFDDGWCHFACFGWWLILWFSLCFYVW